MPAAERSLAVKGETHLMVREEPVEAAEPAEAPAEETEEKPRKSKEEKPKKETKTRSLRGKRSSDKVLTPEQQEFRDMLLDLSTRSSPPSSRSSATCSSTSPPPTTPRCWPRATP